MRMISTPASRRPRSARRSAKLTYRQAKAKLLAILDDVEAGEEIETPRHGVPVARLAPARGAHALKGMFRRIATSAATDEELYSTGGHWNAL